MVFQRSQRVAEEMKREVAEILRNELKDPRIGFVTITSVEVSGDLRYAKVYVSVYGKSEEQKQTLEALNKASGFVRREIGKRIQLRYTPEIVFKFDESIEHGAKIAELLNKVQAEGVSKE
ncbi:30S ribosome-binding factor RbfA [Zhaonella formicivorans]|jgi:ribosome-binding factor A|uniref:30S ribosome-binding factor RbfA n=1 Tax=Zhaonella formicivorans TaxID=2528593 RepID=UPI0010EB37BD|nr:30S ribosome-binding factor RbfA [Zhaonella formicivorans]